MAFEDAVDLTDEESIIQNTSKIFRPRYVETPAVPASFDGKYMAVVILALDVNPNATQAGQLETAIEAIANVHYAKGLVKRAIPISRLPANTELRYGVELSTQIRPVPTP